MRVLRRHVSGAVVSTVWAAAVLGACSSPEETERASTTETTTAQTTGSATPRSNGTVPPALESYRSTRSHDEVAEPIRLHIPAIGVDSPLEKLRRLEDQSIEVPRHPRSAGWWADGPRPGQRGPAVVLGHLDSKAGPAVFFRLGELNPGDEVRVDRADGSTVRFVVTQRHRYDKERFPTELVYYPTLQSELRLVTCGGTIDPSTGHYRENLVVFAAQAP